MGKPVLWGTDGLLISSAAQAGPASARAAFTSRRARALGSGTHEPDSAEQRLDVVAAVPEPRPERPGAHAGVSHTPRVGVGRLVFRPVVVDQVRVDLLKDLVHPLTAPRALGGHRVPRSGRSAG
ncbi:MAG: hypothetical protein AMXMBFR34_16820 [Myxococcaceae bacterium]